jgi:hypothetical protein
MRKAEGWIRRLEVIALVVVGALLLIGYVVSRLRP